MDKIDIIEILNNNLQELSIVENEIGMLELAKYQKTIEKIKSENIKKMEKYFEEQAKIYNQKISKYQDEIEYILKEYEKQIQNIINKYDEIYLNVFKVRQNALNNQKISIANIVTITKKMNNENLKQEEKVQMESIRIACAQKKLDYSIIVEECEARIKWCTANIEKDINEIFESKIQELEIYKDDIFQKVKRILFNKITGKGKYKRVLNKYKEESLKDIQKKSKIKSKELVYTLKGIVIQMDEAKKQILNIYDSTVNN